MRATKGQAPAYRSGVQYPTSASLTMSSNRNAHTFEDVSKHNSSKHCLLVISGKGKRRRTKLRINCLRYYDERELLSFSDEMREIREAEKDYKDEQSATEG
ncbi:Cytochrome b5 isoform E [Bienertia sinuspersici]